MKGKQLGDIVGGILVVRMVIEADPVLAAPDIEQKHHEKTRDVEDKFLDWNASVDGGNLDAQDGVVIWESKEGIAEEKIEREA